MMDISKDKNFKTVTANAWLMLAIFFAAQLVMSAGTYAWGPLAPFFRTEFGVSRTVIGMLTSALYIVAALVPIPSGILVDRLGARAMLLFSLFVMGFGFILMPITGSFFMILLCAVISGLGYGSINQATTKGIMIWFGSRTRATAMGIKKTGVAVGGALSAALIPWSAMRYNWHVPLFIIGGSILVVALLAFFYREWPATDQPSIVKIKQRIRSQKIFLTLVSNPVLLSIIIILPFISFCQTSFVLFLVLYLHEALEFSVQIAGICMTIAMIAGTAGRIA
jgi:MFS family permease